MADPYANIRRALEMGPAPGPYKQSEFTPQRVDTRSGSINVAWYCNFDNGAREAEAEATAALIAACDPDTIRELLAERDALERARDLIRKWRDEANAGYMTGVQEIDLVTNANASTWFRCADELEALLASAPTSITRDNQASRDQVADLLLTDPDTSEPCHVVSLLRRGPGGFQSFDVQSGPDRTRWRVDVRVSESGSADRADAAIAAANGGGNG